MNLRKSIVVVLICVLLLGTFTGCSQKTSTAGKMHYDLAAEPINLDPQTASDLSSMTVINQMFEALFTLDENGEVIPAAASGYAVSEDGLTYQIMIRSGLKWNNGNMLDAEDYAFGLQRVLMYETQSPYASRFFGIKNAEKYHNGKVSFSEVGISYNGLRLTVTLEKADEAFIKLLALTATMPCDEDFFTSTKGKYGLEADATIANGAFYLQTWSHEQYLKLTKNESYRDAANVKISGVTMWTNNIEGREETFWKGNTQACYVSGESYAAQDAAGYDTKAVYNTVYGVVFNQNTEVLQNTNIRKALAALFDRESYRDELPDYLTVTDRAYPSDCAVNSKPYFQTAGEISVKASAQQAVEWYEKGLDELGIGSISGLKIVVLEDEEVQNGDYFLKLSQEYQKYLDLYIGITRLPKEEYEAAIESGDYDLAILPIESEDLSPVTVLSDFASGDFACTDSAFQKLYRSVAKASSLEERTLLYEAEKLLLTDGWFIPMYEKAQYFVCGKDTKGITYNPYTGLVSFCYAEYLED